MLTHKDYNETTVARALCKRWVSACVMPSGIIQLRGHLSSRLLSLSGLHYFLQTPGGATFGAPAKGKGLLSVSRCAAARLNLFVSEWQNVRGVFVAAGVREMWPTSCQVWVCSHLKSTALGVGDIHKITVCGILYRQYISFILHFFFFFLEKLFMDKTTTWLFRFLAKFRDLNAWQIRVHHHTDAEIM